MAGNNNRNILVGESSNERKWIKEVEEGKIDIKYLSEYLSEVPPEFQRYTFREGHDDNIPPIIDMGLPETLLINQIKEASSKFGYFQIINHNVPPVVCHDLLKQMRVFYDDPSHKKVLSGRDDTYDSGIWYNSTHDLHLGQHPTWHDTLYIRLGPSYCGFIPSYCEIQVNNWTRETGFLATRIGRLLAKGLGLPPTETFSQMLGRVGFFGNFYPRCRDPKVLGFQPHTDPCLFTILLQDNSGGLFGLYDGIGYQIQPVPGALVVFIGDLLEILSEGVYQSGIHLVKSSSRLTTRVSVQQTFAPADPKTYLPFHVTGRPKLFKPVQINEYVKEFFRCRKLTIKTMIHAYRHQPEGPEPNTRLCLGPPGERA